MPQFYLIPKRLARAAPAITKVAYWIESLFLRSIFGFIKILPLDAAIALGRVVFRIGGRYSDKVKKAHTNLGIAFPEATDEWKKATVRSIFSHVGVAAVELIKLEKIWQQRADRVEYVIHPDAQAIFDNKQPTLFVTAHVGPWQVANFITRDHGFNSAMIYSPESNPTIAKIMHDLRANLDETLISSTDGLRPLLQALKRGKSICMAMDTRIASGRLVPFFGREALTSTSAAGLALRTGAPLVPVQSERLPSNRYRMTAYPPVQPAEEITDSKEQAVDMTRRLNIHFEDWIRQAPEQWICLKRRWPKANKL